eukprot:Selendium_serpulae@DN431_c0_g1_i1.p1
MTIKRGFAAVLLLFLPFAVFAKNSTSEFDDFIQSDPNSRCMESKEGECTGEQACSAVWVDKGTYGLFQIHNDVSYIYVTHDDGTISRQDVAGSAVDLTALEAHYIRIQRHRNTGYYRFRHPGTGTVWVLNRAKNENNRHNVTAIQEAELDPATYSEYFKLHKNAGLQGEEITTFSWAANLAELDKDGPPGEVLISSRETGSPQTYYFDWEIETAGEHLRYYLIRTVSDPGMLNAWDPVFLYNKGLNGIMDPFGSSHQRVAAHQINMGYKQMLLSYKYITGSTVYVRLTSSQMDYEPLISEFEPDPTERYDMSLARPSNDSSIHAAIVNFILVHRQDSYFQLSAKFEGSDTYLYAQASTETGDSILWFGTLSDFAPYLWRFFQIVKAPQDSLAFTESLFPVFG